MGIHDKMVCIQPATRWEDALPIGNGTIGALVYGNICEEKIVFNHEELWFRHPKEEPPFIGDCLEEFREILHAGEFNFADMFLDINLKEKGFVAKQGFQKKDSYHVAFDLIIDSVPKAAFTDYRRELNFETGEANVSWNENGNSIKRQSFISREQNLFCLKYSCSKGKISCNIALEMHDLLEENKHFKNKQLKTSDIPIKFTTEVVDDFLLIIGTYENGMQFGGVAKILQKGGSKTIKHKLLEYVDSDELTILLKIFVNGKSEIQIPILKDEINSISLNYDDLLKEHTNYHSDIYNRIKLELKVDDQIIESREIRDSSGNDEKNVLPHSNEFLLLNGYSGKVSTDLLLKMFNYGRYLLISSSKPEGWPANLQGVWNGEYYPAWESDYHNDENIQMNYWPALPCNLTEQTLPYFDFYEACLGDYQRNAKVIYNCRGILAPIAQTIKGEAPLYGGAWLNWTSGAGWLGQLFYDYYLFTRDEDFLKNRAIPYLKQVALFYEDFLIKDVNGKYEFCPSLSPENQPDIPGGSLATINATMDIAVAKEILTNLCEGCFHLGIESENVKKWSEMIKDLPDYQINEDGAIKEWIHPDLKDNYHHRHISHIYGLFPGFEITKEKTPEIFKACKIAVEKRLVIGQKSQSGWSLAHLANIYARLNEGDSALQCLELLTRSCVGENLFTYHNDWRHQGLSLFWDFKDKIFQIDANFGLTAAIVEMLIFSNRDMIKVLPALPKNWTIGTLQGIKTRTGAKISIDWNLEQHLVVVELLCNFDRKITLKLPRNIRNVEIIEGTAEVSLSKLGKEYNEVNLKQNSLVAIKFILN